MTPEVVDRRGACPTGALELGGRLLLHCCCGPCAVVSAERFRSLGTEVTAWFYNPNVHPEAEWERRRETMERVAAAAGLPLLEAEGGWAGLGAFLLALASRGGRRCHACYELRLRTTAAEAARRGFGAFSTTLLISPYQDLAALREVGEAAGRRYGVRFVYADLRQHYPESHARSRAMGLYRQSYCGCLFSALERAERRAQRTIAGRAGAGAQVR